MEMLSLNLQGTTGFLNGQPMLHDEEREFHDYLKENGKSVLIIDNLFDFPDRLSLVYECDNIVLSTTGVFAEKIRPLLEEFNNMGHLPKRVIFFSETTSMAFLGTARELKKHGVKFYFPDVFDWKKLIEINWI